MTEAIIGVLLIVAFVAGLIWAIADRIKQKQKEDFEQRDN